MNINEMSEQEKSIKLAKLCGWEISEVDEQMRVWIKAEDCPYSIKNLYKEEVMFLAWRVLNWANENQCILDYWQETTCFEHEMFVGWFELTPINAQKRWLDKILKIAIEAGLVE